MLLCYYKPDPWLQHATLQAGVDILEANLMSTQTAQYGPKDVETFVLRTNNQREPGHYQKAKKGLGVRNVSTQHSAGTPYSLGWRSRARMRWHVDMSTTSGGSGTPVAMYISWTTPMMSWTV
eukprot:PhM_4_TR423/c4_g1_i1/m.71500